MITVTGKLWGVFSLGTLHIKLPIDLPVEHWKGKLGIVEISIETGPRAAAVPAHSVEAVKVAPADVKHEPAHEAIDTWN